MVFNIILQGFQNSLENLDGLLVGGLSVTLLIKIIADVVSVRKMNRSIDVFGGSLGNNGKAILKIVNDFKEDIKGVVAPVIDESKALIQELKDERKEKEFYQEALVTVLSVANVPVAQKKEYYNAVLKVSSISDVAKDSLLASIEADEQKTVASNDRIDGALNLLENEEQEKGV